MENKLSIKSWEQKESAKNLVTPRLKYLMNEASSKYRFRGSLNSMETLNEQDTKEDQEVMRPQFHQLQSSQTFGELFNNMAQSPRDTLREAIYAQSKTMNQSPRWKKVLDKNEGDDQLDQIISDNITQG